MDSCIFITLRITTVWDTGTSENIFRASLFFSLVANNYFNNDYLAASQGASAWQLLIRLPTTTRADWLMSLLHCRWPPAAGPTASPARQRARGDSDCSFPNCFVQPFSVAWPPPLAALNVNPQLSGNALVPSKPTSRAAPARQNALGERHRHMETSDEDQRQFQVIA